MDSELLDAAIRKFLAFDLIANSDVAVVWFGREQSHRRPFKRLDNNLDSRLKLYSPAVPAFNEPGTTIGELGNEQSQCSFAKIISEAQNLWMERSTILDMDCDLVIITSGNFIEDEYQISELAKTLRSERLGLHLIIYPFQRFTDEYQHNTYIKKLSYIQKLFDAKIHIIKEHLDADGNVKMTTLLQFFEIFEYMGKGHSWDQHDSYITLKNQNVNGTDLKFYFDLDSTIENELIVGFVETKKFGITNLQLKSPSGRLILKDHIPDHSDSLFEYRQQLKIAGFYLKNQPLETGTWVLSASSELPIQTAATAIAKVNSQGNTTIGNCWIQPQYSAINEQQQSSNPSKQTTLLKSIKVFVETNNDHNMPYVQDVSARMEVHDDLGDIVQNVDMLDDGLGMPDITQGDGIHSQYVVRAQKPGYYKVFVDLTAATPTTSNQMNQDYLSDPSAQNDYDLITNYRQPSNNQSTRTTTSRMSTEGHQQDIWHQTYTPQQQAAAAIKQQRTEQYSNTPCCGSFIPPIQQQQLANSRYLSRQLYCGTFYIDENNKLVEQKPAKINNLRVTKVDRFQRKITVQWTEPMVDMSSYSVAMPTTRSSSFPATVATTNNTDNASADLESDLLVSRSSNQRTIRSASKHVKPKGTRGQGSPSRYDYNINTNNNSLKNGNDNSNENKARYEIKSFDDINSFKDNINVVNYNSLNVDGSFPLASNYGGTKEVVLRLPYTKEGIYFIVMRTYNNLGIVSDYSNIVKFVLVKNVTYSDDLYNQFGTGAINGYNGDASLLDDLGSGNGRNGNVGMLESLVVMTAITVAAFISVVSLAAVGCCLYNNRNKSSMMSNNSEETKVVAGNNSSASSSTSGCNSDIASSAASSQSGQDVEISKISLPTNNGTNLSNGIHHQQQYSNLANDISTLNINMPYLHRLHNTLPSPVSSSITVNHQNEQSHHLYHHHHHHHSLVGTLSKLDSIQNGTANGLMLPRSISQEKLTISRDYATPATVVDNQHLQQQQQSNAGLVTAISPVQSWPADILLSHYDKVKQAKERNEIPPVMRIETLDHTTLVPSMLGLSDLANHKQLNNTSPAIDRDDNYATANNTTTNVKNHHLDRQSYINQQLQQRLQQQLNNVIPNGSNNILRTTNNHHHRNSSHQIEGTNVVGSRAIMYDNSPSDRLDDFMQQAPPQYVYYNQNHQFDSSPAATTQQQQQQLENQASSIYGQTISNNVQNSCYYANQQQPPSPWTTVDHQPHHHHEQSNGDIDNGYQQTVNNDGYASVKKPSSAVSQV